MGGRAALDQGHRLPDEVGDMEERILSTDILSNNIGIPKDRQKSQDLKRVGEAMRTLRLEGTKAAAHRRQTRTRLLATPQSEGLE